MSNTANKWRLLVAYCGTPFLGWQDVGMGPTIESTLRAALEQLLQTPVELEAASRTDAGVHARRQVVTFSTCKQIDPFKLSRGLNALLPHAISVLLVEEVPSTFHPSLDAVGKEYSYQLTAAPVQSPFERTLSWHVPQPLDIGRMEEAAALFLGTHDFSALCNQRGQKALPQHRPVCTLEKISVEKATYPLLSIVVQGDRFLYKMVRNLVGTLVYAGCGKLPLSAISDLLAAKDRTRAGMTAPAHGLFLQRVFYDATQ